MHSGKKDKEKEEYGLLCADICCEQPPPPYPYRFGQFEAAAVDLKDGL
jgi:hypothetical protein